MKIATFNANSIRVRLPIITDWLTSNSPDVLCIQETKVQDVDFPVSAIEQAGYHCIFKGQKSYNGVAILSKELIKNFRFGLDTSPADEPRIITAEYRGITIFNTYIPQGFERDSEKYQYKLDWLARLRAYFSKISSPNDKLLWLGDFNIAPTDKDVHSPEKLDGHVCFNKQLTEIFNNFLDYGFVDLFRKHNQSDGQFSFWDYRQPHSLHRNLGWRIDHLLASQPLADLCTNCYIDKIPRSLEKPSDHTFVIAEFQGL